MIVKIKMSLRFLEQMTNSHDQKNVYQLRLFESIYIFNLVPMLPKINQVRFDYLKGHLPGYTGLGLQS